MTKYGTLTLLKKLPIEERPAYSKHYWWLCKCDCGLEVKLPSNDIKRKTRTWCSKECGLRKKEIEVIVNTAKKSLINQTIRRKYRTYRKDARNKLREFTLSPEQFKFLITAPCAYCGTLADNKLNGIDRVDNNLGYIIDNCLSCCKVCNRMKSNLPLETFLRRCLKIADKIREIKNPAR